MARPNHVSGRDDNVLPMSIPHGTTGLQALTEAKLWRNPCWFAFRFNHIALRYNSPLYGWIKKQTGLSRPEFVVIYSLGLFDGALARDIAISSGFPKNTLSRAIEKLVSLGLIEKRTDAADRRNQTLHLLPAGRTMFDDTLPQFVLFEERMLQTLSPAERDTLSNLLAKIVLDTPNWADEIDDDTLSGKDPA
jgi:MarR family transcriptional regulator, temperature-dependent positive regulator of motility